jgi:hypothetical protein
MNLGSQNILVLFLLYTQFHAAMSQIRMKVSLHAGILSLITSKYMTEKS